MLGRVAKPIFTSLCLGQPLRVWVCEWITWFKKWNRLRAIGHQPTEFKGSRTKRCWCLGLRKRALTFPNPNPQNATAVQPSAFGGFGTHAPGTTIQSVVSRLHLQRETCTNRNVKTTSMIPLIIFVFGECSSPDWKAYFAGPDNDNKNSTLIQSTTAIGDIHVLEWLRVLFRIRRSSSIMLKRMMRSHCKAMCLWTWSTFRLSGEY